MLEKYFATAGLHDLASNDFIFRVVMFCSKFNKKHILRPDKFRSLSYSTVRSIFFENCQIKGLSLWVTFFKGRGASVLANRGTMDRLWKRHGRWTSEKAKDGYVTDDLKQWLAVTIKMGLLVWSLTVLCFPTFKVEM